TAAAAVTEFLVNVALLAAEAAKSRVEAGPDAAAAREEPQALHGDVQGPAARVFGAGVERPDAPHLLAPDRIEMRCQRAEVVAQERPLQQVATTRMPAVIAFQPSDGAGNQKHVTIQDQDGAAAGGATEEVARRRGAGRVRA